jgi:hypothetical protein
MIWFQSNKNLITDYCSVNIIQAGVVYKGGEMGKADLLPSKSRTKTGRDWPEKKQIPPSTRHAGSRSLIFYISLLPDLISPQVFPF